MAILLVTGLPGVGKTAALAVLRPSRPVLNFGSLMLDAAKQHHNVATRDDLRRLSEGERRALREAAAETLPEDCIVDIHLSVRTKTGLESSIPRALFMKAVDTIIVLEARPEAILERRRSRVARSDSSDTEESLAEQQLFNRHQAEEFASIAGARLVVLAADGGVPAVAAKLAPFLT